MSEIRDNAINFEGVKVSMIQNKDGYMLKLAIHPDDVPEDLLRSYVGARYVVAMVEVDHNEQPKVPEAKRKSDKLVTAAVMLCREQKFWDYLQDVGIIDLVLDEQEARDALCSYLGIESRSEIRTDKNARDSFGGMKDDFEQWLKTRS